MVVRDVATGAEVSSFRPTFTGERRVPAPSTSYLPKLLDFNVMHGTHTVWEAEGRPSQHSDLVLCVVLNGSMWQPARLLAKGVKVKLTCISRPTERLVNLLVDAVEAVKSMNALEVERLEWMV